MKIALTGGIACGKSLFAKFLRELGVQVLDADDVVHELESPGGAAVSAIAARFGSEVLAPDGGVDRPHLAEEVFGDGSQDARRDLESIVHPLVRERLSSFAASCANSFQTPIRVAIIPLLFESHWEEDYDIIVCVVSTEERQLDRMMRTRGYSRAQAEARLRAQMPVCEKIARSGYVVKNDSTPEHLKVEAARLVAWLEEMSRNG